MTFANAMQYLSDGKAAKRPSWAGYVFKTVTDATTGSYTATLKKKDGTTNVYTYNGTTHAWSTVAAVSMDVDLWAAMLADDWITGNAADFATAASQGGTW